MIVGAVVAVLVIAVAAVFIYAARNLNSIIAERQPILLQKVSDSLGRKVEVASIKASLGWGLVAELTIKDGKIVYDLNGLEALAWDAPQGDIAQEHQARIFPVDLTRVNAGLHQERRPTCSAQRFGAGGPAFGGDDQVKHTALRTATEFLKRDQRRCRIQSPQIRNSFVVARRFVQAGSFRRCNPWIVALRNQCFAPSFPWQRRRQVIVCGGLPNRGQQRIA